MDINMKVLGQQLIVCQPDSLTNFNNLVSGTQNFVKFKFELDESWTDLTIFAQFTQNSNSYNIYLDENNSVFLPTEIENGKCGLLLYGVKDNIIAITDCLKFKVKKNEFNGSVENIEITETLYNQLIDKINNITNILENKIEQITREYIEKELLDKISAEDFINHVYIGNEEPSEDSNIWIWVDTSEDSL